MESRDEIYSGEKGLSPRAPSTDPMALTTEISTGPVLESVPNAQTLATAESAGRSVKRKRGRPRKSIADEDDSDAFTAVLPSASASVVNENCLNRESSGGQQNASDNKPIGMVRAGNSGEILQAHVFFVNSGEDISMKIIKLCQQGPQTVFVMACNGLVSSATLRRPGSSDAVTTYEGLFEIISLCGSFTATDCGGQFSRAGGMSIKLANGECTVIGGLLAGWLIAASPVQLILGSYLPCKDSAMKEKKHKHEQEACGVAATKVRV